MGEWKQLLDFPVLGKSILRKWHCLKHTRIRVFIESYSMDMERINFLQYAAYKDKLSEIIKLIERSVMDALKQK